MTSLVSHLPLLSGSDKSQILDVNAVDSAPEIEYEQTVNWELSASTMSMQIRRCAEGLY